MTTRTIEAWNWRGEAVPAERLLARYRMTIDPGTGWRIVALHEVHGRAALHVECRGGGTVDLDWRTSAGLHIPATTGPDGVADLPVNTQSYYNPADGPGPHRIQPAGSADAMVGWGLALGLPDQPPAEIDNRYQTIAVTWAFDAGESVAPGRLIGFELPNRPSVTAEEWQRFDALPGTVAKIRPYHLTAANLAELARRGVAVAVRPDSDGAFASDPTGTIAALMRSAALLRSSGILRIYLIPDSEPNLGGVDPPAGYWDALAHAEQALRSTGARLVSPPMAVAQGDDRWHAAGRVIIARFDCIGVHAYGQQDAGLVTRFRRFATGKPFFVAELGDSSADSIGAAARGAAIAGYLRLLTDVEAVCLFILGTADPAWSRFVLPVEIVRTLAVGGSVTPIAIDVTPIPEAYRALLATLCTQYGADEAVIAAMVDLESGWNPSAIGDGGHSVGLLQLHDQGLGAGMSVAARQDAATNLRIGIRAHAAYRQEFGSVEAAIAAHNAGGPALRAVGGDWRSLTAVARGYVDPVLAKAASYRAQPRAFDEAIRVQLDAIWGVSEQLLASRADQQAWMLRQAVIAIKEMQHIG